MANQTHPLTVEGEQERSERASVTAKQGEYAGRVIGATAGAAEFGSMTAHGRHHPLIAQRRRGSTAALFRRSRDLWAIYLQRRLEPAFREEIMVAVAGANYCRQCSFAHRQWALAEGLSEAELAALEGVDPESFDARTWAALAWAQAYARSDFGNVPEAVDANFRQHCSAQEQADIELIVRTMYWMNETSNGVRAMLKRLKRTPVPGSGLHRELEAVLLYALIAPVIVVVLSVKQRRNPISLIREMRPFFRMFEARGPDTISGPGENFVG